MGQVNWVIGTAAAIIFIIAFSNFVALFQEDNSASVLIDEEITGLNSTMRGTGDAYYVEINGSTKVFDELQVEGDEETTQTAGGVFNKRNSTEDVFDNTFISIKQYVFGGDERFNIVLTVFGGAIAMLLMLYAYKTWFGKNPD